MENGRTGIGSSIYSSTYWDVHAMTAEDLDGDGTAGLVTGFFHPTSGGGELRIYTGNGVTSATNGGYFYSSTTKDVAAMAWEPLGVGMGPAFYVGLSGGAVWRGDLNSLDAISFFQSGYLPTSHVGWKSSEPRRIRRSTVE